MVRWSFGNDGQKRMSGDGNIHACKGAKGIMMVNGPENLHLLYDYDWTCMRRPTLLP